MKAVELGVVLLISDAGKLGTFVKDDQDGWIWCIVVEGAQMAQHAAYLVAEVGDGSREQLVKDVLVISAVELG